MTNPLRASSASQRNARPSWLAMRKLTRAHQILSQRPDVAAFGDAALRVACEALTRELDVEVTAEARVLESALVPATGLATGNVFAVLELSAVGGVAVLELEPALVFSALGRLAGAGRRAVPLDSLTRLEESTLVFLLLAVLSATRAQGSLHDLLGPRLLAVSTRGEAVVARMESRRRHVGIALRVRLGDVVGGARFVLPAHPLQVALQTLPQGPGREPLPQWLSLAVPARCRAGRSRLSPGALETLRSGDVIVFEGVHREAGHLRGPGRLLTSGFFLSGSFQSDGFSLNRAHSGASPQELDMAAVSESSEGMPPLPVDVEIELARVMLPLTELMGMRPGALVPLHINASDPVLLRVGERAVARAELVDIEGEVGARILALLP
ncbi:YscQ/HrcQ family type III secretion apparatus protein [Corallococcus sp. H22C18031201]|nr:YscQ/HrcQ family type III secretion apparatus protein [Corallococcus sp. H22C18031201]